MDVFTRAQGAGCRDGLPLLAPGKVAVVGRVEHFVNAAGFCARLLVELVALDGGLSVDLLAGPHDCPGARARR